MISPLSWLYVLSYYMLTYPLNVNLDQTHNIPEEVQDQLLFSTLVYITEGIVSDDRIDGDQLDSALLLQREYSVPNSIYLWNDSQRTKRLHHQASPAVGSNVR